MHPVFSWSYSLYSLGPVPFSLPRNPTPWTLDLQTSTFYICPCSLSSVSAQPNDFLHFGFQTDLLLTVDTSPTFSSITLSSLTPSPFSPYSEPLIGPTLFSFLPFSITHFQWFFILPRCSPVLYQYSDLALAILNLGQILSSFLFSHSQLLKIIEPLTQEELSPALNFSVLAHGSPVWSLGEIPSHLVSWNVPKAGRIYRKISC